MEAVQTNTFCYNNHPIRVITYEGELWFVAVDICHALGLSIYNGNPNTHALTRGLGNEAKMLACSTSGIRSRSGCGLIFVTQCGLDRIITRSQKVQADDLRDWVNHTVLPVMQQEPQVSPSSQLTDDEIILKAITILQNRLKQATGEQDTSIISIIPKTSKTPKAVKKEPQWLTVNEWCKQNKLNLALGERFNLGRKSGATCRKQKIKYKSQLVTYSDGRGGSARQSVNAYPKHILDQSAEILGINPDSIAELTKLNAYLDAAE